MKETGLFIDGDDYDATIEELETIVEIMKDCDIYEKEIYEAVPNNDNKVRMCKYYEDSTLDCGKYRCNGYTPRNGKNGCCKFNRKVEYTAGKTFIINQKGELTQVIQKKLWVAANKSHRICITKIKPRLYKNYWSDKKNKGFMCINKTLSKELFPNITFENSPQEIEITIKIKQKQI